MKKNNIYQFIFNILTVVAIALLAYGLYTSNQRLQAEIDDLNQRPRFIQYHADNQGGSVDIVGKIIQKKTVEGRYTILVGAYGRFLVTEDEYNSLNVGDSAPQSILERGN